jgi:nucleotide-binding universal stress UspA family protein
MFDLTKILLPIDFSERSADAADAAAAIAEHFHTEITLLHVLPARFDAPLAIPGQRTVIHGFDREEAEETMKHFRCGELRRFEVRHVLREGDPARTIADFAESEHIDLIMMPTHGYGPFRRLLLGSVTAKVLHDVRCPVWTAVHSQETPAHISAEPRRIAAAVDLEPYSGNVLRWAGHLSCEFAAPLSIIHVAPLDPRVEDDYLSPGWREKVISKDTAELAGLMQIDGVNGEIHIEVGSIPDAVIERTQNVEADLLVIGRSGHGGATGRLPTNAYAIIRDAPCPVLAV